MNTADGAIGTRCIVPSAGGRYRGVDGQDIGAGGVAAAAFDVVLATSVAMIHHRRIEADDGDVVSKELQFVDEREGTLIKYDVSGRGLAERRRAARAKDAGAGAVTDPTAVDRGGAGVSIVAGKGQCADTVFGEVEDITVASREVGERASVSEIARGGVQAELGPGFQPS